MDYKFVRDVSGQAVAQCESEASLYGDWLSSELATDTKALESLLAIIGQLQKRQLSSHQLKGNNYRLVLDQDEVELHYLQDSFDEDQELPEGTELDDALSAGCGLEDFKDLLTSWYEFTSGK